MIVDFARLIGRAEEDGDSGEEESSLELLTRWSTIRFIKDKMLGQKLGIGGKNDLLIQHAAFPIPIHVLRSRWLFVRSTSGTLLRRARCEAFVLDAKAAGDAGGLDVFADFDEPFGDGAGGGLVHVGG